MSGDKEKKDKAQTHRLSLKGSSKVVAEFFEYSIHTILFQRGVYPAEDFAPVKKYGLNMLVSADDQVKSYIRKIMKQLNSWMQGGKISKLVIVVASKEDGDPVERWQFDVQLLGGGAKGEKRSRSEGTKGSKTAKERGKENEGDDTAKSERKKEDVKTEKEIHDEIQAIFRQITASVTFLPQLDGNCTFNVLVYADADSEVPLEWGDSDAREIKDGEKVQLRSFSTSSHKVDALVSYRMLD